jgi:hypothetical protein
MSMNFDNSYFKKSSMDSDEKSIVCGFSVTASTCPNKILRNGTIPSNKAMLNSTESIRSTTFIVMVPANGER